MEPLQVDGAPADALGMLTSAHRRLAAVAVAGVVAVTGVYVTSSVVAASSSDGIEQVVAIRRIPKRTATTVRPTTPTTAPTTTQAPAATVAPTTTKVPTPTTSPAPPTTKAPTTTTPPAPPAPPTTQAPATTVAPAPIPSGNLSSAVQQQMLSLVNAKRASGTTCGGVAYAPVPALSLEGRLTSSADAYATDMATYGYFSHTGRDGSDPGTRIGRTGYRWSAWAENIAAGQPTADSVVAGWFGSAGHCVNFMSSAVTQVGFGQAVNPSSTYKTYWVADLARPA